MATGEEVYLKFIQDFQKFRTENNIGTTFIDNMCYGWKIGSTVMEQMKCSLDAKTDVLDASDINRFKSIFDVGQDLMGIRILGKLNNIPNKVYLIQISEKVETKTYPNISFKISDTLYKPIRVKCPVTNLMFDWPFAIKGQKTTFTDSLDSYTDTLGGMKNITDKIGTFNTITEKQSFSGMVNYRTSEFTVYRTNNANIDTGLNLEHEYNEFLEYTTIPWLPQTSGSDSSSSSSSTSSEPLAPKPDNIYYNIDNYTVKFTKFLAPVKKIWEWEYSEDTDY